MPYPTCPKCENITFALSEGRAAGAAFKFYFIHCTKCGAIVGTQPYTNTEALIERLAKKPRIDLSKP